MPIFDHFLIMFDHYIPSFNHQVLSSFVMVCQGLGMISVYVWWAGAAAEKPTTKATGAFTGVGSGIMSSMVGRPRQRWKMWDMILEPFTFCCKFDAHFWSFFDHVWSLYPIFQSPSFVKFCHGLSRVGDDLSLCLVGRSCCRETDFRGHRCIYWGGWFWYYVQLGW